MAMEKTIGFTQSDAVITMNVTGDCVRKQGKQCQTMCNKLQDELAILIGADRNTIEIIKPKYAKRGLEIKAHVYMNDIMKQIDFQKVLMEANRSNELAEVIRIGWELSDNPEISNINSVLIESKQQRIKSDAATNNNGEIEMMMKQQMSVNRNNKEIRDKNDQI